MKKICVIEFWDCHYELIDAYITSMAEENEPAQIDIYCQLPEKATKQSLLHNSYAKLNIKFKKMESIRNRKDEHFDLVIINTSHVHQNRQSFEECLEIINSISTDKVYTICHNQFDYMFFTRIKKVNSYAVFLSNDAIDAYHNNIKKSYILYEPVSDYRSIKRQISNNEKLRIAITGIIRKGKAIEDIKQIFLGNEGIKSVLIGSFTGVLDKNVKEMIRNGVFCDLELERGRMCQERFINSLRSCDLLLDLGVRDNYAHKKSVTGCLQLSRSLDIPLLIHTNRCSSFFGMRYMNYNHLKTILESRDLHKRVMYHKNILQLIKKQGGWSNKL